MYMAGGMWEQARQLCRSAAPQHAREVEEAHKQHLAKSGAAAELVQVRYLVITPRIVGR